jgi:KTSC domain
MNIKPVESATLVAIGYDDTREILQLEFRSHAVYRYFGVPVSVYEALVAAPSKGRYFNGTIRGHFPHSLILRTNGGQGGES